MSEHDIMIYKNFVTVDHHDYLTPNELYLYCYLYTLKSQRNQTLVSIDLIQQTMPVKFYGSKENKNKVLVAESFNQLIDKGIISIDCDLRKYKNNELMRKGFYVVFNKVLGESYTIPIKEFYEINHVNGFYIYTSVHGWNHIKDEKGHYGRQISKKEFSKLLNVCNETADRYIKDLIQNKKIYRLIKRKNDENYEKDINRYRTIPFDVENDEFGKSDNPKKSSRTGDGKLETWKNNVLSDDNYTCQICYTNKNKSPETILHAHHKDGYDWCITRRYDETNGVTLCDPCHTDFHMLYGYGGNTEQQFIEFRDSKVLGEVNYLV